MNIRIKTNNCLLKIKLAFFSNYQILKFLSLIWFFLTFFINFYRPYISLLKLKLFSVIHLSCYKIFYVKTCFSFSIYLVPILLIISIFLNFYFSFSRFLSYFFIFGILLFSIICLIGKGFSYFFLSLPH